MGLKFPSSALKLGCVNNNWNVIFQEQTDEGISSEIKFGGIRYASDYRKYFDLF